MVLGALAALALTSWRYGTPPSSVNGTPGALIAMGGEAALVVAGGLLASLALGGWRILLVALSWIGLSLTASAVWLLHGEVTLMALAVTLVGLVFASLAPRHR